MLRRELVKGNSTVTLLLIDYDYLHTDGNHIEQGVRSHEALEWEVKKKVAEGYRETERSLSRRAFYHGSPERGKFWIIDLEDEAVGVRSGKIPPYGVHAYTGTERIKDYESAGQALREYHRQIAQKLVDGFQEFHPRKTQYSQAPEDLSKKPAPSKAATTKKTAKRTGAAVCAKTAAKEAAAPKEPAAASPPASITDVTHAIDLDPHDWYWATWRELEPLELPEPAPFDLDDCVRRLGKIRTLTHGWHWAWDQAGLAPAMSREEAWFWFTAMTERSGKEPRPKQMAKEMARRTIRSELSVDEARTRLQDSARLVPAEVVACLANLLSLGALLELILGPFEVKEQYASHHFARNELLARLAEGMRRRVRYLPQADRKRIRDRVAGRVTPAADSRHPYEPAPVEFYLGASVGLGQQLEAVVAAWPDDEFGKADWDDHYRRPQELVFGLGDAKAVEHHARRLKLRLKEPRYIRAWLAHTETAALDVIRDTIAAETNRDKAAGLIEAFSLVRAPEAAPMMLDLKISSKVAKQAREWLDRHVGCAVTGAVPAAARSGKLADAAIEYLRDKKRQGHLRLIEAAVDNAPAEAADKVRREVIDREEKVYEPFDAKSTPKWLAGALAQAANLQTGKLPAWADPAVAPPVLVDGRRLSDEQMQVVLQAIGQGDPAKPHPLVSALREKADRGSLAALAWHLFSRWLEDGAPAREKWAMMSLGLFGNDEIALKLTPMIRAWPGESQHPRAVTGLECLRAIGTDTALMQLNGVAQKVKFKGIKQKAMEFMEAIARDRNMSRAELEDRIVPDCGLDERGTRAFDFGPRKFFFVLGPAMKPLVRDAEGKIRADLPKPAGKDDPEKAPAALADWKLLKKQIREVAKVQALRLEQAMVTGRTWPVDQFATLLARHPLMTNLVRLLVWVGLDAGGKQITTFRVTEEQEYADVDDGPASLDGVASAAIAHPLHLTDEQKSRWGELLGDYEIIPPFPQLGRETYGLEKGEADQDQITRFAGIELPAVSLVGTLDRLGWNRGIPEDGGVFHEHSKPFYGAGVTAIVQYPGVPIGYMEGWEDQTIERCFFLPGTYMPRDYPDHKRRVKLGKVDPVVISEVLRDLTALASKGK